MGFGHQGKTLEMGKDSLVVFVVVLLVARSQEQAGRRRGQRAVLVRTGGWEPGSAA